MRIDVHDKDMSLRFFYLSILSILVSITMLSLAWEFWLEDIVLRAIGVEHETEGNAQRWEFVVTTVVFASVALMGPMVVGDRIIRRDQALQEEVTRLSQEDHLTGLFNRRRVTQLLEHEVRRALRYDTSFSVILMDIDHFKEINDQFGHQAGDKALKRIADVVKTALRAPDSVGRWGGEEFLIILTETDIGGGLSLAEKLRTRVESAYLGKIGHRTASFGVTAFQDGDDIGAIIARADAGLYAAKRGGRNRVEKAAAGAKAASGPSDGAESAPGSLRQS